MSDLTGLVTGLAQGLNGYMEKAQANKTEMQQEVFKNQLAEQSKIKEQAANQAAEGARIQATNKAKLDSEGKVTPEMLGGLFGQFSPELGGAAQKFGEAFKAKNGRDLTNDEMHQGLGGILEKLGKGQDDTKEQNHQDLLEKQFRDLRTKALSNRSGGLGLQDSKVNAAMHSRQLIEGARDPATGEVHINQITSPELAMSLASLVSGGNAPALETIQSMTPESLQGFIKSKVGYLFGKPVDVLPKEWVDSLTHQIDRQGLTSEALRDNYESQINRQHPTKLAKDRIASMVSEPIGVSYADTFGLPKMKFGDNPYQKPDAHGKRPPITGREQTSSDQSNSSSGWSYVGPVK